MTDHIKFRMTERNNSSDFLVFTVVDGKKQGVELMNQIQNDADKVQDLEKLINDIICEISDKEIIRRIKKRFNDIEKIDEPKKMIS